MPKISVNIEKENETKFRNSCMFTGCKITAKMDFGAVLKLEIHARKSENFYELGRNLERMLDAPIEVEEPETDEKPEAKKESKK